MVKFSGCSSIMNRAVTETASLREIANVRSLKACEQKSFIDDLVAIGLASVEVHGVAPQTRAPKSVKIVIASKMMDLTAQTAIASASLVK